MRALTALLLVAGCSHPDERDVCERLVDRAIDAQASLPMSRDVAVQACRAHPRAVKTDPTTRCVLDADTDAEVRICISHARDGVKDRMIHDLDDAKQQADEAIRTVDDLHDQITYFERGQADGTSFDTTARDQLDALHHELGLAQKRVDAAIEHVQRFRTPDPCQYNPMECK